MPACGTSRKELYEAAALDGATRWQMFTRITWPLIWPVTVLCLTIQLILQLKIFDQVYLFAMGGRTQATMVLVQYIYEQAFQKNAGGYAATIAVALFVIVVAFSVLQFQVLRFRGARDDGHSEHDDVRDGRRAQARRLDIRAHPAHPAHDHLRARSGSSRCTGRW